MRYLVEALRFELILTEARENGPKVKEILWRRRLEKYGYELRKELWDDSHYGGDGSGQEMKTAYTLDGDWIGDAKIARFLCVKKGIAPEKATADHTVCSIGFKKDTQQWCGWSHRAIACFGIGDKLFKERCKGCTDKTPFVQHGTKTITTLEQAKQAAKNFARSVS